MLCAKEHVINIIMVSYHRPNDLQLCVNSIIKNTYEPFHLTIIDNSIGKINHILDTFDDKRITIIKNNHNLGKGKAFMKWYPTIIKNKNEFFVSIDPDLIVPKSWLTNMLRAAYSIQNIGALAPTLVWNTQDTFQDQLERGKLVMHGDDKNSIKVNDLLYQHRYIAGPLFLINKQAFDKIGGYTQTQLYGNDDGELCKAMYRHKKLTGIVTNVNVLHLQNDATSGYREWKMRNVNGNVDPKGFWD